MTLFLWNGISHNIKICEYDIFQIFKKTLFKFPNQPIANQNYEQSLWKTTMIQLCFTFPVVPEQTDAEDAVTTNYSLVNRQQWNIKISQYVLPRHHSGFRA